LAEASRRGWNEAGVEWTEDAGFSAGSMKRPGLALALEALRNGDAQVLAVSKMDRLDAKSSSERDIASPWGMLMSEFVGLRARPRDLHGRP